MLIFGNGAPPRGAVVIDGKQEKVAGERGVGVVGVSRGSDALCNPLFLDQSSRPQRLGLSKEHQGCHVETLWISHRLALATVDPFAPVASSVIAREGVSEPEGFSPNVSCVDYPKELKKKLTTLGIKIGIESTIVFL
ncbi:hypothetical protein V6N11_077240 [Hibiscus sabdariffa]|uniref:Uncharacterized protein n=1 Tax=Hibiscus sabdariffa TaxID=183260 RepID=A0ABR2TCT8_9ROSI